MLNQQNNLFNKIKKRKAKPQTIASAFGDLLHIMRVRVSDSDLINNWETIVGSEISAIAKVLCVKTTKDNKFNVVLQPVTPAFALELSYHTPECIEKINHYYRQDIVAKITIRK